MSLIRIHCAKGPILYPEVNDCDHRALWFRSAPRRSDSSVQGRAKQHPGFTCHYKPPLPCKRANGNRALRPGTPLERKDACQKRHYIEY